MQHMFKGSGLAVVFGLICVASVAAHQAPAPRAPEQQQAKEPAPVSGELLSLDPQAKTLTIATASGNEMRFTYSDATEIVGADKDVSGLATKNGTTVTVSYSTHGTANTATKIEVTAKK